MLQKVQKVCRCAVQAREDEGPAYIRMPLGDRRGGLGSHSKREAVPKMNREKCLKAFASPTTMNNVQWGREEKKVLRHRNINNRDISSPHAHLRHSLQGACVQCEVMSTQHKESTTTTHK